MCSDVNSKKIDVFLGERSAFRINERESIYLVPERKLAREPVYG